MLTESHCVVVATWGASRELLLGVAGKDTAANPVHAPTHMPLAPRVLVLIDFQLQTACLGLSMASGAWQLVCARRTRQAENAWPFMPLEIDDHWLRLVENTLVEDNTGVCSTSPLRGPKWPKPTAQRASLIINTLGTDYTQLLVLAPHSLTRGSAPRSISCTPISITGFISRGT